MNDAVDLLWDDRQKLGEWIDACGIPDFKDGRTKRKGWRAEKVLRALAAGETTDMRDLGARLKSFGAKNVKRAIMFILRPMGAKRAEYVGVAMGAIYNTVHTKTYEAARAALASAAPTKTEAVEADAPRQQR